MQYSGALTEFIFSMLQKKKVDRPLIVECIDFFHKRNVVLKSLSQPAIIVQKDNGRDSTLTDNFVERLDQIDQENYYSYKEREMVGFK